MWYMNEEKYFLFHGFYDFMDVTGCLKIVDVDDVLLFRYDVTGVRKQWMD